MSLKKFILATASLLLFLTFSCQKDKKEAEKNNYSERFIDSLATRESFLLKEKLQPAAKEMTKDWNEYNKVNELLNEYRTTTASEIKLNAKELARLTRELKDSIRIETFKDPAYRIRLNVLNNEALRLADMSEIPSITETAIFKEYQKVFDAFSAINSKLNNATKKEKINKDLKDFLETVAADSLKKDTTSVNIIHYEK